MVLFFPPIVVRSPQKFSYYLPKGLWLLWYCDQLSDLLYTMRIEVACKYSHILCIISWTVKKEWCGDILRKHTHTHIYTAHNKIFSFSLFLLSPLCTFSTLGSHEKSNDSECHQKWLRFLFCYCYDYFLHDPTLLMLVRIYYNNMGNF